MRVTLACRQATSSITGLTRLTCLQAHRLVQLVQGAEEATRSTSGCNPSRKSSRLLFRRQHPDSSWPVNLVFSLTAENLITGVLSLHNSATAAAVATKTLTSSRSSSLCTSLCTVVSQIKLVTADTVASPSSACGKRPLTQDLAGCRQQQGKARGSHGSARSQVQGLHLRSGVCWRGRHQATTACRGYRGYRASCVEAHRQCAGMLGPG